MRSSVIIKRSFPYLHSMCNLNKFLQQILILYSFVPLNKFSCRCYDTKYTCGTYWENFEWFLICCYYNLPQEGTLEIRYHAAIPNFTALVPLINLWLREICRIRKLSQNDSGLGEKLSSLGKLLLKVASPQLGNISNLKIKGSLIMQNHISDECVNDLSTITLKFHFISSTGKEIISWDTVS